MAKQDEKQRMRRRLQERAVDMAATNRWEEAIELNRQILTIGEDADTYNRLGKSYMELGRYQEAHDAYQQSIHLMPTNTIARKNIVRLDNLINRGVQASEPRKAAREQVDLRVFITETGRTAITSLVEVPRSPAVEALVSGEKMVFRVEGKKVLVLDSDEVVVGRLEPKLSQRLAELISGGNRYTAAIAQAESRQVRLLIREIYQHPSQRGRISFPGKLGEGTAIYSNLRYEDYSDEMIDDDDSGDDQDSIEEEYIGGEEEELGLDEIEQDIGDEDESAEE